MTVSIVPGSARITVTQRPTVNPPAVSGAVMSFTGGPVRATGSVTLRGAPGDDASGWTVGFVQAQWIETNWCSYRGQHDRDGSIFVQRARPPSRPQQACRDCVNGSGVQNIFYNIQAGTAETATGNAGPFPQIINVAHFDRPSESVPLVEPNGTTTKLNFLSETQLEFFFCTILSVRDPGGTFHHLASFYWNQRWQATFHPTSFSNPPAGFTIRPLPAGTGVGVSHIIQGTPTDKRFAGILTSPQTQTCNQIFSAAVAAAHLPGSANRHERPRWANFDVRRA